MLSKMMRSSRSIYTAKRLMAVQPRFFSSEVTTTESPQQDRTISEFNDRVGADQTFNENKHGYLLTFPWNYESIINQFEAEHKALDQSSYWHKWMVNSRAIVDFNNLFRDYHQSCAIPDYQGLERICEPRLASYVSDCLKRIHFHGLDVEMANLTIEQPSIRILKAEVKQGLDVNRDNNNRSIKDYNVSNNHNIFGAKWQTFAQKNPNLDQRHVLDSVLEWDSHRPYLVSLTCLIESPMKLYVQNQNYSSVLFGSNDEESIKNVVRFEANLRWFDFFNMMAVDNKKSLGDWKITDFNNILNENQLFEDE